jgi:ribosomal-protein-alanine N-acetyltransferase
VSALPDALLRRRPMALADLDAVMAIEARAYSHPWSRGNFVDSLVAGYLAEVLECTQDGLRAYLVAMEGADELHLLNLTVHPESQGQGLGRARGLGTLWLEVRESNHRARALYRQGGFAEVGRRRGYYPAAVRREDAVVMSLPLRGADTAGG